MSSFLKSFQTNKTAEEQGVFVDIADGVSVKVKRFNNEKAQAYLEQLRRPYRSFRDGVPAKALEEILRKVTAKEVIADWKGVTDENDVEVKFSPDAAEKLFEKFPDFYRAVVDLSTAKEVFLAAEVDAVKNA